MSEQQKIITSISGSVIGHVLLLFLLFPLLSASRNIDSSGDRKEAAKKKPKEVTVALSDLMEQIEIPPPAPAELTPKAKPRGKAFVDSGNGAGSDKKPENAEFESDRNTVASTETPKKGQAPRDKRPSINGDKKIHSLQLEEQDFSKGKAPSGFLVAAARMKARQQRTFTDPNSSGKARVSPETPADTKSKDGDAGNERPAADAAAKKKSRVDGTLSNKGKNAVNAVATPLGKYKKSVIDAVAEKWHEYRKKDSGSVTWGSLHLKFKVDAKGKVTNLTVTENKGNDALLDLTLRAISEAKLPAMSEEVAKRLGESGLTMKYDVIIY